MHLLILGADPAERLRAAERAGGVQQPSVVLDARSLPFVPRPKGRAIGRLLVPDVHEAFPGGQRSGTRLVLTQSAYLLQTWLDGLAEEGQVVATADASALRIAAPEALQSRGPWRGFRHVDLGADVGIAAGGGGRPDPGSQSTDPEAVAAASPVADLLARAFRSSQPHERAELCRRATAVDPQSAVAVLALASTARELEDAAGARLMLDRALAMTPDWEAVHYEDGKFWLACEEMDRARAAFERACHLMPSFSGAWSNLGATLGELNEPEAALTAFERALVTDPDSISLLSNFGVVTRELGRLDASETALRRVLALDRDFVFGHYNLAHTLFLQGRYPASVRAYEEGQRRDPRRNRRQACRLAVARFAAGDLAAAERDLMAAADSAPVDEREDLLLEAYEVAHAVAASRPESPSSRAFLARLAATITRAPGAGR